MKKHSACKSRTPTDPAKSLVGRASAKARMFAAMADMHSHLTRISVKAYLTDDAEPAPVLLGDLALILGIGAEIGINRAPQAADTRRMHAALRTVLQMSVNGRRWQAAQAKVLHEAAALAVDAFETWPGLGVSMMPGACELAEEVRRGTARMDAVAGVEIYNGKNATERTP